MKTKHIVYPVAITLMILIPTLRYYLTTPDINGCVLDYVDNLEESNYSGYMYAIDGVKHIEPANSRMTESLKQYEIGQSQGCLMISDNLFSDLNNTFYCAVTYMIRKSPIKEKYKQPLEILKTE